MEKLRYNRHDCNNICPKHCKSCEEIKENWKFLKGKDNDFFLKSTLNSLLIQDEEVYVSS